MKSDKISILCNNAERAIKNRDYQSAHRQLLQILQIDPEFANAFFLLAMIPLEHGNTDKAIELIKRALSLCPDNSEYCVYLTKCYALKGDVINTAAWVKKSLKTKIYSAFSHDILGVALSRIGLHEKAVQQFKAAIALKNNEANFYYNLAAALKFLGEFDEAKNAYENTLKLEANHYKAHAALSTLGGITLEKNHISRLVSLIENAPEIIDKLHLSHALATEYEALGEIDQAFNALDKAKTARRNELQYSFDEDKEMFDSIKDIFSDENINFSASYDNKQAIFVVGMPRTGTTLVERIISNHSNVKSVGELHNFELLLKKLAKLDNNKLVSKEQMLAATKIDFNALGNAYIESVKPLTGGNFKFVDKLPLNILLAGFIAKALPNCKIICLDREPLDTIVSNYRQMFSPHYAYCNYSNSLLDTARYYSEFKKLMLFWQLKIPNNFTIVNYEKLVNSPEIEAKKMIKFCGLPWQAESLAIENNSTPVATASAMQVRQPITNKSVGNWKKYEKHLDEVKKILIASNQLK
jgi:tetratricopeptide (TPR) repeat protein